MKKITLISSYLHFFAIFTLLLVALPSTGLCGGDHGETCGTATTVTVPSLTAGTAEDFQDRDYFRFIAPVDGEIVIFTTGAARH